MRIDSLAYGGNGVGRVDGFVVFVRGGLPGDLVRARATKVKRGFAEATRTALLEPGPDRVEAPCRHFGICGGCRFQDYAYEHQTQAKEQQVRDALTRLGRFAEPPVEPIVPARSVYGYRNKLEYSFAPGPDGLVLGFHRAGRWDEVIDVEECLLTTDVGNAIREAAKEWARAEGLEPYDQDTQTGYLRHLVVREGRNTGQALVLLVTAPGDRFDADFLIETLTRIPEVRSIHWAVNDQPSEITNLPTRLLWGAEWIEEELLGVRFRVRPNAFLQTNTEMAETLYELARDAAGLTGRRGRVRPLLRHRHDRADARTRRGLRLGRRDLRGVGRVRDRERAGERDRRTRPSSRGTSGSRLEELRERAGPPDVVVVDPPRAGLAGKALRRTGALQARRIVYVSCNPTTLASDLAVLRDEYGYELVRCTPVDMFPHTPHIESVSLLRLSRNTSDEGEDGPAAAGATDETKVDA